LEKTYVASVKVILDVRYEVFRAPDVQIKVFWAFLVRMEAATCSEMLVSCHNTT
jgi:hypothetical protein